MSLIKSLWECAFSPRLYKLQETTWKSYEPNGFERWSDFVVTSFAAIWSISLHALPFIATLMYRRSTSLAENAYTISKFVVGAGAIIIASLAVRGCARVSNPTYLKFIKTLNKARQAYNYESKQDLLKYDFEFWAWPVDFRVDSLERSDGKPRVMLETKSTNITRRINEDLIFAIPCEIISYIVANTIAIKLMYPGSMSLVNMAMRSTLLQGRIDLLDIGGQRSKLITQSNLVIDTMFVDRRHK
ncbi:hypothetical protein PV327_003045 [Microctonus hyperodae]|uniref:Phosphatidylserine Lipase ABHD16 N-terminal domain-containing protein n=1 Tax=Microctonus hyperodae TaxID=165561 RepID=A0AA39L0R3_MICHY|nr:hypothetical protein PV327_003045 [Microctonus hyperodae]